MSRVRRRVLFTTGDSHSLDNGGGVVARYTAPDKHPDLPGREWINFEWWYSEDYEETGKYTVYSVDIYPDMLKELDWLKPSPIWPEPTTATNSHLAQIAECIGTTVNYLIKISRGTVEERVEFVEAVLSYYGPHELDSYPIQLTRTELRRRWRKHVAGSKVR